MSSYTSTAVASPDRSDPAPPPYTLKAASVFSGTGSPPVDDSVAPGDDEPTATFDHVHNLARVELTHRCAQTRPASLERLPRGIFMRIMMYCGYKDQILLKRCSYSLYRLVDLDAIPWEIKTETILIEERDNPRNYAKKEPKEPKFRPVVDGGEDEEGEFSFDGESPPPEDTANAKKANDRAASKRTTGKGKAHSDTYGRWGCYYCYKILPAYYFEGQLLEEKEGRAAKNHETKGGSADEADKKVDMRVEYVQVLGTVSGGKLPGWWLTKDMGKVKDGVDCDDLRLHYRDMDRERHLVAPLRAVNPIFTPLSTNIPKVSRATLRIQNDNGNSKRSTRVVATPSSVCAKPDDNEPSNPLRPLYKVESGSGARGDVVNGSYTYELLIPQAANRPSSCPELPNTKPVGNVRLPSKNPGGGVSNEPDAGPQIGDVMSLRRVCIPCGTKFAIYRRDSNRKIISKTQEAWWVCDCPQVRLAGKSTGCRACGRKVIF